MTSGFRPGERAIAQLHVRAALEVGHDHDLPLARSLDDSRDVAAVRREPRTVDRRDVRMIQRGEQLRFAAESCEALGAFQLD